MTQPSTTTACDLPGRPGPAGHVNACQLCPASPTYWRGQNTEPPANSKPCRWTPTTTKEQP